MKKIGIIIVSFVLCVLFAGFLSAKVPVGKLDVKNSIKTMQNLLGEYSEVFDEAQDAMGEMEDILEDAEMFDDTNELQAILDEIEKIDTKSMRGVVDGWKIVGCKLRCLCKYREYDDDSSYKTCLIYCYVNQKSEPELSVIKNIRIE